MWKYLGPVVIILATVFGIRLCCTRPTTPAHSTCRCGELDLKLDRLKQQYDALARAHSGFRCSVLMNWDKVVEINQKRLGRMWGEDAPLEMHRAARSAELDRVRKEGRDNVE